MDFNMERWYASVGQRFSMRKYGGNPPKEDLDSLRETAAMLSVRNLRIAIGVGEHVFSSQFLGIGKVKGTRCFAAFLSKDADPYFVGYLGEAFILECTALGLGTCWLGASFSRKGVGKAIKIEPGERIVSITSIGQPGEPLTTRPRKSLQKLTGLSKEELTDLSEWQQRALECARHAPSAANGQPWEFDVEQESITIVNTGPNFGYGKVDCGIAMLHLELGAAHAGVAGKYEIDGDSAKFSPVAFGR